MPGFKAGSRCRRSLAFLHSNNNKEKDFVAIFGPPLHQTKITTSHSNTPPSKKVEILFSVENHFGFSLMTQICYHFFWFIVIYIKCGNKFCCCCCCGIHSWLLLLLILIFLSQGIMSLFLLKLVLYCFLTKRKGLFMFLLLLILLLGLVGYLSKPLFCLGLYFWKRTPFLAFNYLFVFLIFCWVNVHVWSKTLHIHLYYLLCCFVNIFETKCLFICFVDFWVFIFVLRFFISTFLID